MPLVDLLEQRRAAAPRAPFLHADGSAWTAEQLARRAGACATALARAGVRPRDHIALFLDNSADFVALLFGVARLGAVAVTVNTALRGEGLAHVLCHSDARLLVVEERLGEVAAAATADCRGLEAVWTRGDRPGESTLAAQLDGLDRIPEELPVRRDPGEVASILYTSGTTGLPKGVMLTDHGYEVAGRWFAESFRLGIDDVLHTCLPLFHVNAQHLSLCGALVAGAQLVLDPRFSASQFWDSIVEHRVTSFNLIGAMLGILHAQASSPVERAHRARVACVAPTPPEIHRECEERFGVLLLDGYGLTETTPGNAYNPYEAPRLGSCGTPAPYVEVRIADEEGRPLRPGQRGEILLRALEPAIFMVGYYKDREATDRAFRDGWFRTSDRGYLDEDGYLYFVDRLKDVIRRRGENISATEIERVARTFPGVWEAAAVGVSSDLPGGEEDVALFLLAEPGAPVDPEALVEYCSERLAEFMVPRYVKVLDEFPRTETQRIRKAALKERGVAGSYDRTNASSKKAR